MALKIVVLLKILQMVYSTSIPNFSITCQSEGGIILGDECFIFSAEGDVLSWQDAVEKCLEQYGPLATPADPYALYRYTSNYYEFPFWVGGYSPHNEKYFRWINGTQIPEHQSEFPWGPGEPLPPSQPSEQRCVEVNYEYGAGYASQPCSNQQRYICSLDACGALGGVTLGYQCLSFQEDQNATWGEAADACRSEGGELAIPTYPKLLINYVHNHFEAGLHFWLGGLQVDLKNEDSWYWLNGQPIQVCKNPWVPGTPEDQDVITKCLDVKSLKGIEAVEPEGGFHDTVCDHNSGFICELDTSMTPPPTSVHFVIRQILSGEYIGPDTVFPYIQNGDYITLHDILDPNMHMAFDIVEGKWGYIRHVITGKILTPMDDGTSARQMNPPDGTKVVLQSDRRPWALFALDQYQNRIIHRSGKFISSDGKCITITGDESQNDTMGFQFLNITIPDKEVLPYGYPIISGDWQLVFSVLNSESTHTYSAKVTIGKSESLSSSHDFKFGFEVARNERSSIHTSSCSNWPWSHRCTGHSSSSETVTTHSISEEMQQGSADTWNSARTKDFSFTVEAGKSVAAWQRIFIVEHRGHKAVHLSNIFADTDSSRTNPNNLCHPKRPGFSCNPNDPSPLPEAYNYNHFDNSFGIITN